MNITDRTFSRLVLGALTIGFAALVAAGAMAVWTVAQNQAHARLIEHAYQVNATIGAYQIQLERAETARRGYLLDQSTLFEREYAAATRAAATALDGLDDLIRDPQQQQRYARLRALTRVETAAMDVSMNLAQSGDLARAQAIFDDEQSVSALLAIRALSEQMVSAEDVLLAQRNLDERGSLMLLYAVLGGAGLLLLLVGLGSGWVVRRYTGSLAASRDALRDANTNLETAVDERTADLRRANDEIQRFAYIISHDLRAPLVNIMGFTAELEAATKLLADHVEQTHSRTPTDVSEPVLLAAREDLPEATSFIRSSAQKMDRLINAILRLAREGRRSLNPEPLEMRALITTVTDSLEHRLVERGATITVETPLPDLVNDRIAVEQLFSNLLENAVKYLDPARPGRIVVRATNRGERIVFDVIDNGRGIDPRDHQRIFDLFRRSGAAGPGRRGHRPCPCPGAGLPSRRNHKLHFHAGRRRDVFPQSSRRLPDRKSRPMTEHRAINIIMVEDDEGHARLIEKNIRRAGISNELRHFLDGTSALEYLFNDAHGPSQNGPALVLLDLNLPDMSGLDILARIKGDEKLKRSPVVVLTTTDDKVEIERCYDMGANVYITKPVNYESFSDAIRQLGLFLAVIQVPESSQ